MDCLRLSTKYDVEALRQACIAPLRVMFPDDLVSFQRMKNVENVASARPATYPPNAHIVVINLVRELDLPLSLLPAALYSCCSAGRTAEAIFDKCVLSHGRIYELSHEDIRTCVIGYERLAIKERYGVWRFIDEEYGPNAAVICESPDRCKTARKFILDWYARELVRHRGFALAPLSANFSMGAFCDPCRDAARKSVDVVQQALWDELPNIFALGAWNDLRRS